MVFSPLTPGATRIATSKSLFGSFASSSMSFIPLTLASFVELKYSTYFLRFSVLALSTKFPFACCSGLVVSVTLIAGASFSSVFSTAFLAVTGLVSSTFDLDDPPQAASPIRLAPKIASVVIFFICFPFYSSGNSPSLIRLWASTTRSVSSTRICASICTRNS